MAGPVPQLTNDQINAWFDSFQNQMKSNGIDISNPMQASLIRVRNDFNYDEFDNTPHKTEEEKFKRCEKYLETESYAFIPKNLAGKNTIPPQGKSFHDYITESTKVGDDVDMEMKRYLYQMSQEHRLFFTELDEVTMECSNQHYVNIMDGKAVVAPTLKSLYDIKSRSYSDKVTEYGFTKESIKELDSKFNDLRDINYENQSVYNTFNGVEEGLLNKSTWMRQEEKSEEEYQQRLDSFLDLAKSQVLKDRYFAYMNKMSGLVSTKEDAKRIENRISSFAYPTPGQPRQQPVDLPGLTHYPVIAASAMKLSKTDTITNAANSGIFFNEKNQPITGSTNLDFLSNLSKNSSNSYVYVPKQTASGETKMFPYTLSSGFLGLISCIHKDNLMNEYSRLAGDMTRTDSKFRNESENYRAIQQAFKDNKEVLSALDKQSCHQKNVEGPLNNICNTFDAYRKELSQKAELDSKEVRRLVTMQRFERMKSLVDQKEPDFDKHYKDKIAEKLLSATISFNANSKDPSVRDYCRKCLLNPQVFNNQAKMIYDNPDFQAALQGKSEKELLKMVKTKGEKLMENKVFETFYKKGEQSLGESKKPVAEKKEPSKKNDFVIGSK